MLKRIKKLFNLKKENNTLSTDDKIGLLYNELGIDTIQLHVGEDLSVFEEVLCDVIQKLREEIKDECGFIIPNVHIRDNTVLQENEFVIYIRGNFVERGFLIPNEDGIREEFYETLKTTVYGKIKSIFTNEVTERYIDTVQKKNGLLIRNITSILSVPDIKIILSEIIDNGKSINDIGFVFEKIGEEILLNGEYSDILIKKYNPHKIAKEIIKQL